MYIPLYVNLFFFFSFFNLRQEARVSCMAEDAGTGRSSLRKGEDGESERCPAVQRCSGERAAAAVNEASGAARLEVAALGAPL